jgi:glycine/D-amino acid oxidase-like deaminating enzyme
LGKRVYDVAVIGAGVFGAWAAYKLRQSRKKVILIDAFGAGNSRSSSGDESRIIRCGYGPDEIYTRMAKYSLGAWQELFKRTRCSHLFENTGVLWLGKEQDAYIKSSARVLKRVGVKIEAISIKGLSKRYPQFNFDGLEQAIFEPHSGALLGRQAVQAVCKAYVQAGGEFRLGKIVGPAVGPRTSSITLEDGETISAAVYIFACGPWLPQLFPSLLAKRMFITRQEVLYFGSPARDAFRPGKMPVWLDMTENVYGFPELEGRGVKAAFDNHGPPFDPDTGDRLVKHESILRMQAYLARRLPALARSPVVETRVCQYENSCNGDFLLDRHPEAQNVWLAGAGSGHGFKHGPAVGAYLLAQIEGPGKAEPRFSLASKATLQNRAVF